MFKPCTIGDLVDEGAADIQTGPFGTQLKASEYVSDGVPVINVRNIGYSDLRPDKLEFVTEHKAEQLGVHRIEANDIVFGRKGAVDRHLFVQSSHQGWVQGSDCIRLRISGPSINSRFLSYAMLSEQHKKWMLNQCGNKATMASLNQDVVKRIPLALPDRDTQDSIVGTLSAYDDLIENNRRRIALLEDAARQLYKEWFVRFRFPGHEHVKIIDGVPEGWERSPASTILDVLSGGTPKTTNPQFWNGEIGFFTPKDATEGTYVATTEKTITEEGLAKCNSRLYPKDTLFITARGTVGKMNLALIPMAMNQSCYALKSKSHLTQRLLYLTINASLEQLRSQASGAVFDAIIVATFDRISVIKPEEKTAGEFDELVDPIFDQIANLGKQIAHLAKARDLLLPKLMSGSLAV